MADPRFYAERCDTERIVLAAHEARHALKSRRLSVGDPVALIDGRGTEAFGRIASATSSTAEVAVERVAHQPRPRPTLTLWVAMPKGPRQDVLIEKCCELGTGVVCPLRSARSVADVSDHRRAKWRRTAIEAAKQSGQCWVPDFPASVDLGQALAECTRFDRVLLAVSPSGRDDPPPASALELSADLRNVSSVAAFVGPEGGWTDDEVAAIRNAGARTIHLGPNTLRIETAAILLAGLIHTLHPIHYGS